MLWRKWGGRWGLNPRPPGSQPGALPTELRPPWFRKRADYKHTFHYTLAPIEFVEERKWGYTKPCSKGSEASDCLLVPPTKRISGIRTIGTPERTRTSNPRLRRPMLYPVELRAHIGFTYCKVVGVERFELPTSCSQSRRATRLRYTPKAAMILRDSLGSMCLEYTFGRFYDRTNHKWQRRGQKTEG